MPVSDDYIRYKHRRYGMDHDRYDWSMLHRRKPVVWPNGAKVALWVTVGLQFFPLNQKGKPFRAPGSLTNAYPDLRHYTLRDYGNRVGIYRLMELFRALGIPATAAVNAAVAERYPSLIRDVVAEAWEIIAHGRDMDTIHHAGMAEAEEAAIVKETLSTLRGVSGLKVAGWLSPAQSESWNTPDLVAAEGVEYICDWVNDDLPYAFRTKAGTIHSMPHPIDLDDYSVLIQNHHSDAEFAEQIRDQFAVMQAESERHGGRVMAIALHPWVVGQPYRMKTLSEALGWIVRQKGVWPATGAEILAAFKDQR
ncbi:MAG: polysaccharide deacetylase family protein [Alphaproteobacteria bacterium]|nr:polysaccharide deacetylase family protein [Alphaproteobacteria bacterium]